jgi:hypothetical protein
LKGKPNDFCLADFHTNQYCMLLHFYQHLVAYYKRWKAKKKAKKFIEPALKKRYENTILQKSLIMSATHEQRRRVAAHRCDIVIHFRKLSFSGSRIVVKYDATCTKAFIKTIAVEKTIKENIDKFLLNYFSYTYPIVYKDEKNSLRFFRKAFHQ